MKFGAVLLVLGVSDGGIADANALQDAGLLLIGVVEGRFHPVLLLGVGEDADHLPHDVGGVGVVGEADEVGDVVVDACEAGGMGGGCRLVKALALGGGGGLLAGRIVLGQHLFGCLTVGGADALGIRLLPLHDLPHARAEQGEEETKHREGPDAKAPGLHDLVRGFNHSLLHLGETAGELV